MKPAKKKKKLAIFPEQLILFFFSKAVKLEEVVCMVIECKMGQICIIKL